MSWFTHIKQDDYPIRPANSLYLIHPEACYTMTPCFSRSSTSSDRMSDLARWGSVFLTPWN